MHRFFGSALRLGSYEPTGDQVRAEFRLGGAGERHGPRRLFSFDRAIRPGQIATTIYLERWLPPLVRSLAKLVEPRRSLLGVSELLLAALRTAVFEPVEALASQTGWSLVHGSCFVVDAIGVLIAGPSRSGKSSLSRIYRRRHRHAVVMAADNYVFVRDDRFFVVPEVFRSGPARHFRLSFYGRAADGHPRVIEGHVDHLFVLDRPGAGPNTIEPLPEAIARRRLDEIYWMEAEGAAFDPDLGPWLRSGRGLRGVRCYACGTALGQTHLDAQAEAILEIVRRKALS